MSTVRVRAAQAPDASVIAFIYNEGIAEREATFETEPRYAADFHERIASERYLLLVAELDGRLVGWAGLARYSERDAYAGIAECSIYVARSTRGRGGRDRALPTARVGGDRPWPVEVGWQSLPGEPCVCADGRRLRLP
jgi:L-amino acid N-acyltransferase YncA